ncbi:MAG: TetR/AcrR family transcriptional regulator [Micromonosporaceae bacterium]
MTDLLTRVMATEPEADAAVARILDAGYDQIMRYGLRRTTVDDVARRARLGRATVYRRFPQKDQLIEAVLLRECRRFLEQLDAAIGSRPDPRARIVEGYLAAMRLGRHHPLLRRLLDLEPETALPHLTTYAGPVLAMCRRYVARLLGTDEVAAEVLVRLVHSLLLTPEGLIPTDGEAAREFARDRVVPAAVGL